MMSLDLNRQQWHVGTARRETVAVLIYFCFVDFYANNLASSARRGEGERGSMNTPRTLWEPSLLALAAGPAPRLILERAVRCRHG